MSPDDRFAGIGVPLSVRPTPAFLSAPRRRQEGGGGPNGQWHAYPREAIVGGHSRRLGWSARRRQRQRQPQRKRRGSPRNPRGSRILFTLIGPLWLRIGLGGFLSLSRRSS